MQQCWIKHWVAPLRTVGWLTGAQRALMRGCKPCEAVTSTETLLPKLQLVFVVNTSPLAVTSKSTRAEHSQVLFLCQPLGAQLGKRRGK